MERKVLVYKNAEELSEELAKEIMKSINKKAAEGENYYISLSGGSTPKTLFRRLTESPFKERIKWKNLMVFWGDERCVPPDDAESNYGMTKEIFLDKVQIPEENIFRMRGEGSPPKEAKRYSIAIRKNLTFSNNLPVFDLMFLGMGEDGHIASLFPNQKLKDVANNICGVGQKEKQKRISLTYDAINNAKRTIFMITGESKAKIICEIINNKNDNYPATKIKSNNGISEWWLDQKAALKL